MKLLYMALILVRTVLETRQKKQMKAFLRSVLVEIFCLSAMEILILEPTNCRGFHLTTRGSKIVGDNIVKFRRKLSFTK